MEQVFVSVIFYFMSFHECVVLFQKEWKLFIGAVIIFLLVGFCIHAFQPLSYRAEITMNVARSGVREVGSEYTYDDFYRLQADERFADTVVRWLQSPRILADIHSESKVSDEQLILFDADRLSSQVIRVRYSLKKVEDADAIANAMFFVLNRESELLNMNNDVSGWFHLVGGSPFVSDARVSFLKISTLALMSGIFLGVALVFFNRNSLLCSTQKKEA